MNIRAQYDIERVRRVDDKLARACFAITNESVGDAECFSYYLFDSVNVQSQPMFVARQDSAAVGFLLGSVGSQLCPAWVEALYVSDSMQGRGVGAALLSRMEEAARRAGARQISLKSRDSAVGFYERQGYLRQVMNDYIMNKTL